MAVTKIKCKQGMKIIVDIAMYLNFSALMQDIYGAGCTNGWV